MRLQFVFFKPADLVSDRARRDSHPRSRTNHFFLGRPLSGWRLKDPSLPGWVRKWRELWALGPTTGISPKPPCCRPVPSGQGILKKIEGNSPTCSYLEKQLTLIGFVRHLQRVDSKVREGPLEGCKRIYECRWVGWYLKILDFHLYTC